MRFTRAFGIASITMVGGMNAVAACSDSTPTVAASDAATDTTADTSDSASDLDAASDAAPVCNELPGSYGSKSCNDCMKKTCCGIITTCEGEPECKALQKCTLECIQGPDAKSCYNDGCLVEHAAGKATWDQVYGCWYNDPPKCGPDCR